MEFKVRDLLNLKLMKDGIMLGGSAGLDNVITGVNIIESPDIVKFMHEGEVLLTGMYAFKSCSLAKFETYLKKMKENQISVLVVKTPSDYVEYKDKIELLKSFALDNDFAVVELPYKVSFRDLMVDINEYLFNEEVLRLKYFKSTHENFSAMISSNTSSREGIKDILYVLGKMIGNPVALFGNDKRCLFASSQEFNKLEIREESEMLKTDFYSQHKYMIQHVKKEAPEEGEYEQMLVYVRDYQHSLMYLAVTDVTGKSNRLDVIAVENALAAIKQLWIRQQLIDETKKKLQDDTWNNLLYGKLQSLSEQQRAAENLGVKLRGQFRVIALEMEFQSSFSRKVDEQLTMKAMIREIVQNEFEGYYSCDAAERLILIETIDDNEDISKLRKDLTSKVGVVAEELSRKASIKNVRCGVGKEVNGMGNIQKSFEQAVNALQFAEILGDEVANSSAKILLFSDMGIFHLLTNLSSREEMEQFIPESIQKLYHYRRPQRDDLLNTLTIYLNYNQNLTKTAQALFVHYKTAAYRVDRIVQITGIDFDNPKDVLSARIGLVIGKILESDKEVLL